MSIVLYMFFNFIYKELVFLNLSMSKYNIILYVYICFYLSSHIEVITGKVHSLYMFLDFIYKTYLTFYTLLLYNFACYINCTYSD